jgi:hypothetical protein
MSDPNWFQKKWGKLDDAPVDDIFNILYELKARVERLEEENVSLSNELYRMENSLDARIDILAEHCRTDFNV